MSSKHTKDFPLTWSISRERYRQIRTKMRRQAERIRELESCSSTEKFRLILEDKDKEIRKLKKALSLVSEAYDLVKDEVT